MAGPWEKYQQSNPVAEQQGPWAKYAATPTPPDGVKPGSREYADWAAKVAASGKAVPQVSGEAPAWNPPDIVPAPVRAFVDSSVESTPVVGGLFEKARDTFLTPGGAALERARDEAANRNAPIAAGAGQAFGTLAPLAAAGMTGVGGRLLGTTGSLPVRVGAGAASAGVLGAGDTLARGGSVEDAKNNAIIDAGIGGALPFAGAGIHAIFRGAKPAGPTVEALQAAKTAAYDAADNLGAHYNSSAVDRLVNAMDASAAAGNISPVRHSAAWDILQEFKSRPQGATISLPQLDQMRQVIYRDLVKPGLSSPDKAADAHFGRQMIEHIDDFIDNAKPTDMLNGSAADAAAAIQGARAANATYRKVETLDELVDTARNRAASTGSGGNIDNALRQGVRRILDSKKASAGFSPNERAVMEALVRGSAVGNAARLVGKLSPSGNGLMAALGLGATAANPVMAIAPAVGMVAKKYSDNATLRALIDLRDGIASGGAAAPKPQSSIWLPPVVAALLANPNQPGSPVQRAVSASDAR